MCIARSEQALIPYLERQMRRNNSQSIGFRCGAAVLAALQVFAGLPTPAFAQESDRTADLQTRTPIKHVIVIIGENRTFDHVFATYKPVGNQKVDNLLSKGIIKADGTPGPNYWMATQNQALDSSTFEISPESTGAYGVLPPPLAGGPTTPYFSTVAEAKAFETGLPDDQYYTYMTTGGTGLPKGAIDTRIPNATSLPPGPFRLHRAFLTTPMRPALFIATTRCSSNWTAMRATPMLRIRAVARPICFPGWRRRSAPDRTASRSLRASTT